MILPARDERGQAFVLAVARVGDVLRHGGARARRRQLVPRQAPAAGDRGRRGARRRAAAPERPGRSRRRWRSTTRTRTAATSAGANIVITTTVYQANDTIAVKAAKTERSRHLQQGARASTTPTSPPARRRASVAPCRRSTSRRWSSICDHPLIQNCDGNGNAAVRHGHRPPWTRTPPAPRVRSGCSTSARRRRERHGRARAKRLTGSSRLRQVPRAREVQLRPGREVLVRRKHAAGAR